MYVICVPGNIVNKDSSTATKGFRGRAKHITEVFTFSEGTEAVSSSERLHPPFLWAMPTTEFDTFLVAHDQVNAVGTGTVRKLENGQIIRLNIITK